MQARAGVTGRRPVGITVVVALMLLLSLAMPAAAATPGRTDTPYNKTGGPPPPKKPGKAKTTSPPARSLVKTFSTTPQTIPDPNAMADDLFGVAVAISEDDTFAVISAPYGPACCPSPPPTRKGMVWVYTRDVNGLWANPFTLPTPTTPPPNGGYFGASVAINYDSTNPANRVIVVGASGAGGATNDPGTAYIYTLNTGSTNTWTFKQEFDPTGGGTSDLYGNSVALSADGNTVLIGAPRTNVGAASQEGVVYAYFRSGSVWSPATPARFSGSASVANDNFGQSVALSFDGNTALVGSQNANGHGEAYVYTGSAGVFPAVSEKNLTPGDGTGGDQFGQSVALSGDGKTALIGAPFHITNDPDPRQTGLAYLFMNTGGTWGAPQKLSEDDAGPNDTFLDFDGWSVALSGDGNTAVSGAIRWGPSTIAAGAVWAYARSGASFVPLGQQPIQSPDASGLGPDQNDAFGFSVALPQQGSHILIGQPVHTVGSNDRQGETFDFALSPDLAPPEGALPVATVNVMYTQQFTGSNGAGGAYTYSSTTLPMGLTLAPNGANAGLLSGTPTQSGDYSFDVTVTDKAGGMTTQSYTLHILAATTTVVSPVTAPFSAATQNITLTATVTSTATVNEGTVTFAVTQGVNPIGSSVTSGTVTSGTATAMFAAPAGMLPGAYTITATYNPAATNPTFATSTNTGTLTISPAPTTVTVTNASAPFSTAAQNVTLNATVSAAIPVNEGTVTFAVTQGVTPIGTAVTSGTVVNGAASVTYVLPANTVAGGYTITATYNPAATNPTFATNTGTGTLTVSANATTVTVTNASASFSAAAQNVTFSATVTDAAPVNEGTVTFTVKQGATTIGVPVTSGTVTNGAASAVFSLPAGTAAGAYTITAVYNPAVTNPGFTTSTGTGTLTIGAAATTVAVTNATAFFATTPQNVTLSATVSSAIPVNEGTVTFTLLQGATPIGTPITSGTVTNGAASTPFPLPGNTPAGAYTIRAVYNPAATNPNFTTSTGTGTLTVSNATVTKITLTPASATVKVGASAQFTATATLSDSTSANVTDQAQWNTSNAGIASVDGHGKVTGQSPGGPVTITAALNGITSNGVSVTVSPPTAIGIQVPPAPASRPSGTTSEPGVTPAPAPAPSAPPVGGTSNPGPIPTGR